MTTVKELIKFLEILPQDLEVDVVVHEDEGGYYMQGGICTEESLELPSIKKVQEDRKIGWDTTERTIEIEKTRIVFGSKYN